MEKNEKKRINAGPETGLTRQQVQVRMEQGLYNKESILPTNPFRASYWIIYAPFLT